MQNQGETLATSARETRALEQYNQRHAAEREARRIADAVGPQFTREQVGQWLTETHHKLTDHQRDQQRIAEAAALLARSPWMADDPMHAHKVDVRPMHKRPGLLPEFVASPVRFAEFKRALAEFASEAGGGPDALLARELLTGRRGDLNAEVQARGLHVDPVTWQHELEHPEDTWPSEGLDPNAWDLAVLEGRASEHGVPFLETALRGELTLQDYLNWCADHPRMAERVRPKLGALLRAAVAKGLLVQDGSRYRLATLGRELHVPLALRSDDGRVAG